MKNQQLLTDVLKPRTREEVQIHPKKMIEVSNWMKNAFSKEDGRFPILYLSGPTGSGKSTTAEVLCREQHYEFIDYTPELFHDDFGKEEDPDSTQLIRFLLKRHAGFSGDSKRSLLFISELPDECYNDPSNFQTELSEALYQIRHPVIFCLSNDIACWKLNPDRIFTKTFNLENSISTITFNPVAEMFMTKAISRAARILDLSLSTTKLKVIGEEAHGDLRLAMNMIQMNSVGRNMGRMTGGQVICTAKANREEAFHMIGRILYAKRVNPNAPKLHAITKKPRKSVPIPEPTERTELEYDATDIIAMSSMTPDSLVDFLFQNDAIFCSEVSEYRHVADSISLCDVIMSDWNIKKELPDEYVQQIATRTCQWYNYKGGRPNSLYAVSRPANRDLEKDLAATKNAILRAERNGLKDFGALTAPYRTIIEGTIDSKRIDMIVARPMDIPFKIGRDKIEERLDRPFSLSYRGRKPIIPKRRNMKNQTEPPKSKTIIEDEEDREEETYTIEVSEDSSDDSDASLDSFDRF